MENCFFQRCVFSQQVFLFSGKFLLSAYFMPRFGVNNSQQCSRGRLEPRPQGLSAGRPGGCKALPGLWGGTSEGGMELQKWGGGMGGVLRCRQGGQEVGLLGAGRASFHLGRKAMQAQLPCLPGIPGTRSLLAGGLR